MTDQEKIEQEKYEIDKIKREELIESAINLPFEKCHELQKPNSINDTKNFYNNHFKDYGKYCVLPYEIYIMSEFWFNEAGFHFKWRNHKMYIQSECLSWKEVFTRLTRQ